MTAPHFAASRDPRVPRAAGGTLVWAAALGLALLVAWAAWAPLDIVTRATGQIIASSRNQVVQAPEGGVLEAMLVREGMSVQRGQVLFRFESARATAAYRESHGKAASLRATIQRLETEVLGEQAAPLRFTGLAGFEAVVASQRALYERRRSAIREELAAVQTSLDLVRQELALNLPLLTTGDVSRADILKLQRQAADLEGQISNRRNRYFQEAQAELTQAREELDSVQQVLAQRREQLAYTEVAAPMDGVVRNVRLTTRGGVARPGDEILQIVPADSERILEARLRPADMAYIRPGLPAVVKLDAYDYTLYGSLAGEVSYVSADTLMEETSHGEQPYYRVQIRLWPDSRRPGGSHGSEPGHLAIQPGMTGTVEVKTGTQTVLRYLTTPLVKTLGSAMGER